MPLEGEGIEVEKINLTLRSNDISMYKAKITEIFSSIQGEGLYAGEKHTFIRFYGCNLSCEFCDEKAKAVFSEYTPLETVEEIGRYGNETVSLTGGEPLLCVSFLKEFLPLLKEKGFRVYLETNGTLKDSLLEVLDYIDIISMDIKLPSSTGLWPLWEAHYDFLKEAARKEVFVKAVVSRKTHLQDVEGAIRAVGAIDKNIPFILQPVSYNGAVENIDLMPVFFRKAKDGLYNVRIIPQFHKLLGVR